MTPPLLLTKIFLHHWHRFRHHLIEVQDSLYLTGHNGSGKSSVLDAIQLVMVADMSLVRFNRLADDKSKRDLDSYVRGKLGEDRYLRPNPTVGVVALEFATPARDTVLTAGVCLEAAPNKPTERLHFLLAEPLDTTLFVPDGKNALTRRDLKNALKPRPKAKIYDGDIEGYQKDVLNKLGNLDPKQFYELFLRALHFRPENDISRFVEQWVLDDHKVKTDNLLAVRERLNDLQHTAQQVRGQLNKLETIIQHQGEYQRLTNRVDEWGIVLAGLKLAQAEHRLEKERAQHSQNALELQHLEQSLREDEARRVHLQEHLDDLNVQLHSSTIRQEADRLDKRIRELEAHIAATRHRRHRLHEDLNRLTNSLRPWVDTPVFAADAQPAVHNWLARLAGFDPATPPPSALPQAHTKLLDALEAAQNYINHEQAKVRLDLDGLQKQQAALQTELRQLEGQPRRRPTPQAEHLRQRLEKVTQQKVEQLWEVLDIPEQHQVWQEAVEAMLGARRFNFVVPPTHFEAAARELRAARREDRIEDYGLIDLNKVPAKDRPSQPNTLAEFVTSSSPDIQHYINHVLGNIVACANDADLRLHHRAITADLMLYAEWVQRPVRKPDVFIGQQAVAQRIATVRKNLDELEPQVTACQDQLHNLRAAAERLRVRDEFVQLTDRLNDPLDERDQIAEKHQVQTQRAALDLSGLATLEEQAQTVQSQLQALRAQREKQHKRQGQLETEQATCAQQIHDYQNILAERVQEFDEARARVPAVWPQVEKLLSERRFTQNWQAEIGKAEESIKRLDTQRQKAGQEFFQQATQYNTQHNFTGHPADPNTLDYDREKQRLIETDLPAYAEKIEAAKREADQELREHVLHSLREKITEARRKLNEINRTLRGLDFRGEKYHFVSDVNPSQKEFYDLLMQSNNLGDQPLHSSDFYQQNLETFERFFEIIIHQPTGPNDPRAHDHEALLDYRRYLTYDIHITHPDGREERLSKTLHQRSGGETQTPFYFTIAASFYQRYRVSEHTQRSTLRLVLFDEAFSKMDQTYIKATLHMFQRFGLQIVTATPLERCEYIAPHVRTTLVLTGVSNGVDILRLDDYRNAYVPPLSPVEATA